MSILTMLVRDYECDLQRIVNNAVYQNYLEHARHLFLAEKGIDFVQLSSDGIDLVIVRCELDYIFSLRPHDEFKVITSAEKQGETKLIFTQTIEKSDGQKVLNAKVIGVAVKNGRAIKLLPEFDFAERK